jgi:hypothetical protein
LLCFFAEGLISQFVPPPQRFLDYVFWGPTFLGPVLFGLALGYIFAGKLPRLSARLLFVVPLILAAHEVWDWIADSQPDVDMIKSLKVNFLGSGCGGSQCLEEPIVSAPLFSSIAYSIGSELAAFRVRLKRK